MEIPLVFHATFLQGLVFISSLMVSYCHIALERNSSSSPFPSNFLFGTASSAYQYEGAFLSDGKGLNNWDVFSHQPGNIMDGTDGDIALDHYHRYLEDIDLMDFIGVNSYRFSISWARILPKGRFGKVNKAGIDHYNKLIDALLDRGIEPFVTLNHYEIPKELEDRYGTWLCPQLQEDFRYYADICFESFGNRVKYWATFNEPNILIIRSYRKGTFPRSYEKCRIGDSERELFVAAHNIIISHAAAVNTYRSKYQAKQGGVIGIVIQAAWFEPISDSFQDKLAAERAQGFYMNWFLEPVIFGNYPAVMEEILGHDLPVFSLKDQEILRNGVDFIGINHYSSRFVKDCLYSACKPGLGSSKTEGFALLTTMKSEIFIGEPTDIDWLFVNPDGMNKMVTYIKERYNNIPMFITENGFGQKDKYNATIEVSLNDTGRVNYMSSYLGALETAMREGADVRGYFAWSLLDNFEWNRGYVERFGLHHVDYTTLKRTPRLSTFWYKGFIAQNLIRRNVSATVNWRKLI